MKVGIYSNVNQEGICRKLKKYLNNLKEILYNIWVFSIILTA